MSATYIVVYVDEEGYGVIEHETQDMENAHFEAIELQRLLSEEAGRIDIYRFSVPECEPLSAPDIDLFSSYPLSGGE